MDKILERIPITAAISVIIVVLIYLVAIPIGIYFSFHIFSRVILDGYYHAFS